MALVSATPYYPKEAREIMQQFTVEGKTKDEWQAMRKIHPQGDEQIKLIWQQASTFSQRRRIRRVDVLYAATPRICFA